MRKIIIIEDTSTGVNKISFEGDFAHYEILGLLRQSTLIAEEKFKEATIKINDEE
jgi:hypothetical protein